MDGCVGCALQNPRTYLQTDSCVNGHPPRVRGWPCMRSSLEGGGEQGWIRVKGAGGKAVIAGSEWGGAVVVL